jgi:hypothetical protein
MKHRFVLLILISLLSLSLVTVTLVAAGIAHGLAQTPAGSTYEISRFELWIDSSGWTRMWGEITPAVTVTVWLPHEPFSVTSSADPGCDGCFVFTNTTNLYPGDVLSVTTGGGDPPLTIHIPNPLVAQADSLASNQVWGQIGGWYTREVEVYNPGGWLINTATTDGEGNFSTTFWEMPGGQIGYIRFVDLIDSTSVIFHRPFADLEPQIRVNYAGDEIEGDYEFGHTLWLTVTNATGEAKAVISGTTGPINTWGGWSGWVTNVNIPWNGPPPDIQPYDYVYVRVDNGRTGVVRLPEINGSANEAVDTVSGNLVSDWLTGTVYVGCAIWYPSGPGLGTSAAPPDYPYVCDFAGLFDILPGMMVGVDYREPDNDQVFNVIQTFTHLWLPIIKKP